MNSRQEKRFNHLLIYIFFIWLVLFVLLSHHHLVEFISSLTVLSMDALCLYLSWSIYNKLKQTTKKYYWLLFLSILAMFISNLSYIVVSLSPAGEYRIHPNSLLFMLPYFVFLLLQVGFWLALMYNNQIAIRQSNKTLIPFVCLNLFVYFVFIAASIIEVRAMTYLTFMEATLGVLDLLLSSIVVLALIVAKEKGIYAIALSVCMMMATNFWWLYVFNNKALGVSDYSSFLWFLSMLFMITGLYTLNKKSNKGCFSELGSLFDIKSQITLCTYSLSIFSIIAVSLIGYLFNLFNVKTIESLPLLILLFSIILIAASSYIGDKFEMPFIEIKKQIKKISSTKTNEALVEEADYGIDEFHYLESFIKDLFDSLSIEKKTNERIIQTALQAAHDIRSPVITISEYIRTCRNIPDEQKKTLIAMSGYIEGVAEHLLKLKFQNNDMKQQEAVMLVPEVHAIVSQKNYEFSHKDIEISLQHQFTDHPIFLTINKIDFQRMLSNMINNAVESMEGTLETQVTITTSFQDSQATIAVSDKGSGMDDNASSRINQCIPIKSQKKYGYGLGLAQIIHAAKASGGTLKVASTMGVGTTMSVNLPTLPCPNWLTCCLTVRPNDTVVIYGPADMKAHWQRILIPLDDYSVHYFSCKQACAAFIRHQDLNQLLLVSHCDQNNHPEVGLDLIEKHPGMRSIFMTDDIENDTLIKQSMRLNTKIIPSNTMDVMTVSIQPVAPLPCPDIVLLDDNQQQAELLSFLCQKKGIDLQIAHTPFELFALIENIPASTPICLDYDLGCPINGIELSVVLHDRGYKALFLCSGHRFSVSELPPFLKPLCKKTDVIHLL